MVSQASTIPDMANKKTAQAKSAKRPVVYASVPRGLLEALERYLASTRPRPDKSSTVEAALEDFLKDKGFWPPPSQPAD